MQPSPSPATFLSYWVAYVTCDNCLMRRRKEEEEEEGEHGWNDMWRKEGGMSYAVKGCATASTFLVRAGRKEGRTAPAVLPFWRVALCAGKRCQRNACMRARGGQAIWWRRAHDACAAWKTGAVSLQMAEMAFQNHHHLRVTWAGGALPFSQTLACCCAPRVCILVENAYLRGMWRLRKKGRRMW